MITLIPANTALQYPSSVTLTGAALLPSGSAGTLKLSAVFIGEVFPVVDAVFEASAECSLDEKPDTREYLYFVANAAFDAPYRDGSITNLFIADAAFELQASSRYRESVSVYAQASFTATISTSDHPISGALPSTGVAVAANPFSYAASLYQNIRFNSFAMLDGVAYAAGESGIYSFTGQVSDTRAHLGARDFGDPSRKQVGQVNIEADGAASVLAAVDGKSIYSYATSPLTGRNRRAVTGKGLVGIRAELQIVGATQLDRVDVGGKGRH